MELRPSKIRLSAPGGIAVAWEDGHQSLYPHELLRQNCPCALCRENPPVTIVESNPFQIVGKPSIKASRAAPIGNYAIQFFWNDQHSTGIYTYSYLRDLCPCEACGTQRRMAK